VSRAGAHFPTTSRFCGRFVTGFNITEPVVADRRRRSGAAGIRRGLGTTNAEEAAAGGGMRRPNGAREN